MPNFLQFPAPFAQLRTGTRWSHLALAAFFLAASAALAPANAGLLLAASTSDQDSVATASVGAPLGTMRSRLVEIDLKELASHVAPLGLDRAGDRADRAAALDGAISIELFPDAVATFQRTSVDAATDSGYAWSGDADGNPLTSATLIVDRGEITGSVQLGSHNFIIEPVQGNLHRVSEINVGSYPNNPNDYVVAKVQSKAPSIEPEAQRANTVITLLVAFTAKAKSQDANILNNIKLAVSLANKAYANTKIPITLKLLGTMGAGSYNEGADTSAQWLKVLKDVSGQTSATLLANVRNKRNTLKADLVALIVEPSTIYCGLAWYTEIPNAAITSDQGFSEQAVGCLPAGTVMPHELGHNMGLNHDRKTYRTKVAPNRPNPPASKYNFGFINDTADKIDIMSYQSSCVPAFRCVYVPWFSTPKFKFGGTVKLGIPKGTANAADASRRLTETRAVIAAYR